MTATLSRCHQHHPPLTWLHIGSSQARNCIFRGSRLKSEWAHGVVIYTGEETKIRLNAGTAPSKKSSVDVKVGTRWTSIPT